MRPRKIEEGEERGLCLTPCSVFKMVAFICSESVIPAIPDSKRDRVHCFIHCSQATYFGAFGVERSYIKFPIREDMEIYTPVHTVGMCYVSCM